LVLLSIYFIFTGKYAYQRFDNVKPNKWYNIQSTFFPAMLWSGFFNGDC